MIREEVITITAGATGAGTATSAAPLVGEILSVRLAGTALGGTADFTLTRQGDGGTVLVVTDGAAPWQYAIRDTTTSDQGVPIAGYLTCVVAQATANASAPIYVFYRT